MVETMMLIPVRTSRQGTSLNAGKLKAEFQDETATVQIHSDDMARLGLKKGDKVRMRCATGSEAIVSCKAQKGSSAVPGLIFMAYGPISSRFMEADTAGTGMPISKQMAITLEGPLAEDGSVIALQALLASNKELAASPLSPEQIRHLNALSTSQLSATQSVWLSAYFAGMSGLGVAAGNFGGAVADSTNLPLMTILFGSETGNSEHIATELFDKATAKGFNVRLQDMMAYDISKLASEQLMFVIVSTQGEGEPPLTASKLHSACKDGKVPKAEQLEYSVFALGDSSYEFYCQAGKDFDGFLENAGATRILDRVDADIDYEAIAEIWINTVLNLYQDRAEAAGGSVQASSASTKPKEKSKYSKTNPYFAPILNNINLSGEGSTKENCHIEIALEDSGLSYQPGDALGVYPLNNPEYVKQLLSALKMTGAETVTVGKESATLRQAFMAKLDITALSRVNIEKYANLVASDALKTLLRKGNSDQLNDYTWGRQIVDMVEDHPANAINAQDFVDVLRKMPARLYSIASSLTAHPSEVHLLVGSVRYTSFDRDREGVCSTFLNGRIGAGQKMAIYVHANKNFALPANPNTPIIMVGPGTGLAPFRAFLEERKATGAEGKNWLFFGDQHQATDYLYADELEQMQADGLLTKLDLAFSRDQEQKIYVQTRLLESAKAVYQWLEQGAYFYLCGDAEHMAHDVHQALIATVASAGGKSQDKAESYVNDLLTSRRYQRDIY